MTGELVTQQQAVVNPLTGEVIDPRDATTERLGELLSDIREWESQAREAKGIVTNEVLARFDHARQWTAHCAGFKLTAPSDESKPEYDTNGLVQALDGLVNDGVIDRDAALRAVEPQVSYRVHAAGIKALLKNPDLAARLEPFIQMTPPTGRRVTVSRPA